MKAPNFCQGTNRDSATYMTKQRDPKDELWKTPMWTINRH
jgi:hypothetical protein